jgi:hypothetical protein
MTLTGNVSLVTTSAIKAFVVFTPLTQPTMVDGILQASEPIYTESADDGEFSVVLNPGSYRMTVRGQNVNIYIDDDSDAGLEEVITDDIVDTTAGGSGQRGYFEVADVAALRLIRWATTNRRAWLLAPQSREPREWYWDNSSTATDDGLTVVKPFNRTAIEPGRWLVW